MGQRFVPHIHPARAGANGLEICGLQVGRQGSLAGHVIGASEGLAGEVIVFQRKAAGELAGALAQDFGQAAGMIACQRRILGRRDAQAIQRSRVLEQCPQQPVIENRGEPGFEIVLLFLQRRGFGDRADIDAQQPAQDVTGADEATQEARAVKSLGEGRNAAAPEQVALLPVATRRAVEMRRDMVIILLDV